MNRLMQHVIAIFILASFVPLSAGAIGTNFRAQGHYYSAKEALKMGAHEKALQYVYQSKQALNGTNPQLQYLHIISAYNAGRFSEAQKEMATFFDIEEKKIKPIYFDKSVDRLTQDEVREVTMLINKIDEGVVAQDRRDREQKEADLAAQDLTGKWYISEAPSMHIGARTLTIERAQDGLYRGKSEDVFSYDDDYVQGASTQLLLKSKVSENNEKIEFVGEFYYLYRGHCQGETWLAQSGYTNTRITYHKTERALTYKNRDWANENCDSGYRGWRSYKLVRQ